MFRVLWALRVQHSDHFSGGMPVPVDLFELPTTEVSGPKPLYQSCGLQRGTFERTLSSVNPSKDREEQPSNSGIQKRSRGTISLTSRCLHSPRLLRRQHQGECPKLTLVVQVHKNMVSTQNHHQESECRKVISTLCLGTLGP